MIEGLEADPELFDRTATPGGPRLSAADTLANARLIVSTDAALRSYFEERRSAFVQMVAAEQASSLDFVASDGRTNPENIGGAAALAEQVLSLHLNFISRQLAWPDCIFVSIGGILDNAVGYLYAPPACVPPEMSTDGYILIEPIAPGWFLFKTT